ncbi:MAG TPA: hypothetical protein VK007_09115 [Acidimicrobiales bacterium]|nr:hypothetical protein [Acidimicrobiales bacterium]
MDSCIKHPHEVGVSHCGRCGGSWCGDCLVHPFGPKKPPYCMSCAMFAAGVRTHADRPALSRRELKALEKAARAAAKGKPAPTPAPAPVELPAVPEPSIPTAAPEVTDWSSPWWESRQPTLAD